MVQDLGGSDCPPHLVRVHNRQIARRQDAGGGGLGRLLSLNRSVRLLLNRRLVTLAPAVPFRILCRRGWLLSLRLVPIAPAVPFRILCRRRKYEQQRKACDESK